MKQNDQDFLHDASKCESDTEVDIEISSLEEFIQKSQSSASTSFACAHSKAAALHKLGILQWKCGRYFFSEHALADCLNLYQHLLDKCNPDHSLLVLENSHVFVSMGRVYLSKGEGDAAMQCYRECVRLLSFIPKSTCSLTTMTPVRLFAQACVGAGRALASQGKLKASLKRYKRALKVQLGYPAADSPVDREEISALKVDKATVPLNDVAETFSHLGRLYEQRNDLHRAMECFAESLAIYRSVLDPYAVDIGYVLNNIGQLYLRLGRAAEAEDYLIRSHQVFSLSLGRNHRNTADALLSIGQLYASQGQHKKALTTYKRVLRAEPAVFGQLHAVTLHSIACSYEAIFRLGKALRYYQKLVSALSITPSPHHLNRARLLHHMAEIAIQVVDSTGEHVLLDESADWLEEAAEINGKFDSELLYESIKETTKRIKRRRHKLFIHITGCK
ncbi:hypothetical protein ACHAXR_013495 [Thalassiosira sp. AJA248-18]